MNRKEVEDYSILLQTAIEENSVFDKPVNIFNIDETGQVKVSTRKKVQKLFLR